MVLHRDLERDHWGGPVWLYIMAVLKLVSLSASEYLLGMKRGIHLGHAWKGASILCMTEGHPPWAWKGVSILGMTKGHQKYRKCSGKVDEMYSYPHVPTQATLVTLSLSILFGYLSREAGISSPWWSSETVGRSTRACVDGRLGVLVYGMFEAGGFVVGS